MPDWSKTEAFQAADTAWSAELVRLFGAEAGDVRYTPRGRGEEGTELRKLYEARDSARIAWEAKP
jgi:hypothetical protein